MDWLLIELYGKKKSYSLLSSLHPEICVSRNGVSITASNSEFHSHHSLIYHAIGCQAPYLHGQENNTEEHDLQPAGRR